MRDIQESSNLGIAPTIRARVSKSDDRFWRPEDFDGLGNSNAVDQSLSDLHAAGELRRIRRGLYWRGRRTAFGMSRPSNAHVIEQVTGLTYGIGPSGYSAALALGLSTQVPRDETFALPIRVPTGLPEGTKAVSRSARRGRLDAKLRPQEVAWLEIAGSWRDHVSDPSVAENRFRAAIQSESIRSDRIAVAARTEPPAVRRIIASLLRSAGQTKQADRVPVRSIA